MSYDIKGDRTVAVKEYFPRGMTVRASDNLSVEVLASEQADAFNEGKEKFSSEAVMLSQVNNWPEIIGVYDVFDENGTAYFVMEFVNGITLKEYILSNGVITANQAVYILKKLLPSLNILHSRNIIHRDITPENIMLCLNGDVKLIDFGSARHFSEDTEDNYSVILKPGFASLEQYQHNGNQGAWTDIYSLALSLYYGMTLNIPYDPMTRLDDDTPFRRALEAIPENLREIISKSANVRKEDRYTAVKELIDDVEKCGIEEKGFKITCKESNAKPPFFTRYKRKILTAAVALVALAAIFIGVFFVRKIIDDNLSIFVADTGLLTSISGTVFVGLFNAGADTIKATDLYIGGDIVAENGITAKNIIIDDQSAELVINQNSKLTISGNVTNDADSKLTVTVLNKTTGNPATLTKGYVLGTIRGTGVENILLDQTAHPDHTVELKSGKIVVA